MHSPVLSCSLSDSTVDEFDYDIISDPGRQSLDSSIADYADLSFRASVHELPPSDKIKAGHGLELVTLSSVDIQNYVLKHLKGFDNRSCAGRSRSRGPGPCASDRTRIYRVYVDGVFDTLNINAINQLRQAKLSFSSVHLLVGPFTDSHCLAHGLNNYLPHIERSEQLRHLRWVDEVIQDAPANIDDSFLSKYRIDFVAIEEGASISTTIPKASLAGYDFLKSVGKAIPTRRIWDAVGPSLIHTPAPSSLKSPKCEDGVTTTTDLDDNDSETDIPEPREDF